MIKHVLLWQFKDELSAEEKKDIRESAKYQLTKLVGVVPGLVDMKVEIEPLETSNADVYMEATCVDQSALKVYAVHPEHVKVKDMMVENAKVRLCMDYEVSDWNAENMFRDK